MPQHGNGTIQTLKIRCFDTGDNKIDLSNLFTATSDEVSSAEH